MPSKKYLELQEFSESDLMNELNETQAQYDKMKFDHAIKGLDNPLALREVRRDLARLNTEIRRRELADIPAESRSRIKKRRRTNK